MNIDRDGARAAGWTDEQIDAYIMSQSSEPAPAVVAPNIPTEPKITEPLINRDLERDTLINAGLGSLGYDAAGKLAQGAGIGLGGYAAYRLGDKIFGPRSPGPVTPPATAPATAKTPMGTPVKMEPSLQARPAPAPTAPVAPQVSAAPGAGNIPLQPGHPALNYQPQTTAQRVQQIAFDKLAQISQRVAPALTAAAPAAAIAAPFMAAGSRVADIQARPNAPEYATNPRAMSERSGGQMTTGQAGALNRRRAAAGFYNR